MRRLIGFGAVTAALMLPAGLAAITNPRSDT